MKQDSEKIQELIIFMVYILHDYKKAVQLLNEAMEALELCLTEDRQSFTSEQAANKVVFHFQKWLER